MVWNLPPLCMLGFVSEKVKSVFFQSPVLLLAVGGCTPGTPCSKIPPLTAHGLALSNSCWELPDFGQTGASWRWSGQEKQNSCPLLLPSILPATVTCRLWGELWQTKPMWVFGVCCSAVRGSNQREGRLVHSEARTSSRSLRASCLLYPGNDRSRSSMEIFHSLS